MWRADARKTESACRRHIFWYLRQCGRGRRDGLISRLIEDVVYILYILTRGRLPFPNRKDKRSSLQLSSLEAPLASSPPPYGSRSTHITMKTSTLIYGITSTIPLISAFPTRILDQLQQQDPQLLAARTKEFLAKRQAGADSATAVFEAVPVFDAESQFVDVGPGSGHEWQAPGPNDLRGECPGLYVWIFYLLDHYDDGLID